MDDSLTNTRVGRYEIKEKIGRGGMAAVYRAEDTKLGRQVAVKIMHRHLMTHPQARARFEREARAVAGLQHPALVEVYDYAETDDGQVYIVMELVEGCTLREFLDGRGGRPLLAEAAALIARRLFDALAVAHEHGVVHRDVKPENILIDARGDVRLSDFGIAYLAGIGQMTTTGQILGSPAYMSPEHIEQPNVDHRADVFSMGVILYEMVCGQVPFAGNNPHQIIKRVVEGYYDHPLIVQPAVGQPLADVIVRCLQVQPADRFATAQDAVAALDAVLAQSGIFRCEDALRALLRQPDVWEKEVVSQVVPLYLKAAQQARRQRDYPTAMHHLNRVLALDPGNAKALQQVESLAKRRRRVRIARRVWFVGWVVAMLAGAGWWVHDRSRRPASSGQEESDRGTAPVPAPGDSSGPVATGDTASDISRRVIIVQRKDTETAGGADSERPTRSTSPRIRRRPQRPSVKSGAEEPAAVRTVVFHPRPMNVTIVVDGSDTFVYKISERSRDLPVGSHRIEFIPADERLQPLVRVVHVTPGEDPLVVGARLQWKPATLLVTSNVDTVVTVHGKAVGRTNRRFAVPMEGPQEQVRVVVSAPGYVATERRVALEPGELAQLQVNLEKSAP